MPSVVEVDAVVAVEEVEVVDVVDVVVVVCCIVVVGCFWVFWLKQMHPDSSRTQTIRVMVFTVYHPCSII